MVLIDFHVFNGASEFTVGNIGKDKENTGSKVQTCVFRTFFLFLNKLV